MSVTYHIVPKASESHAKIKQYLKDRNDATKRRFQFVKKCFPDQEVNGWEIIYWGYWQWAVIPPEGFEMPTSWKKVSRGWVPRQSRKQDKALWKEMHDASMNMPENAELAKRLGIKTHLESSGDGLHHYTVGFLETPKRDFVIQIHPKQKAPADCVRISDIEFEKLMTKRRRKAKA